MSNEITEQKNQAPANIHAGNSGLVLSGLEDMWRFAGYVASSGFAPKGMEKRESILIAVQMGMELGLAPMQV